MNVKISIIGSLLIFSGSFANFLKIRKATSVRLDIGLWVLHGVGNIDLCGKLGDRDGCMLVHVWACAYTKFLETLF